MSVYASRHVLYIWENKVVDRIDELRCNRNSFE